MTDFFFALMPIAFLIVAMTKPRPVPSAWAFLIGAVLAFATGALYFQNSLVLLSAAVMAGLLEALTPIAIVCGAVLFFVSMEKSGSMAVLKDWLRGISPNPVAQIMIVGWAFMFLIEGASGFGTPAALAAPILVGLGFPVLSVAALCLVFNTTATPMGAVGTPLWFGFGPLELLPLELRAISQQTALLQMIVGFVVPALALRFLLTWREIGRNLFFILLSIASCTLPFAIVATWNFEFPSVVGGLVGVAVTILFARLGIGLKSQPAAQKEFRRGPLISYSVFRAMLPLLATVLILLVTRIPALGLRGILTNTDSNFHFSLGGIGEFSVGSSLVFQLQNIFGQELNWTFPLLYVPAIIPFFVTAFFAVLLCGKGMGCFAASLGETAQRVKTPVLALFGALIFVKLLMVGDECAATQILGHSLASAAGESWIYFAPFLGALGSFFSGSATISNLTFGGIQASIAAESAISSARLLALQASGAAMGNMVCIHNMVAVCAVLGLKNAEGSILKKVFPLLLLYGAILALLAAIAKGS